MKKRSFFHILFSSLIAMLLLAGYSLPAAAGGKTKLPARLPAAAPPKLASFLTVNKPAPADLGKSFTLDGSLKDAKDRPIVGRSVLFTLNGEYLGQAKSDENGLFVRKFTRDLDAGDYSIVAYWTGTHDFAPASTVAVLTILPTVVRVQTVPAVAGLPFSMANQRFVSDAEGIATVKINRAGDYRLTALVDQYHSETQRIKFGRWLEESYDPTSIITVPTTKTIQVGLNVFRPVGQSFLDLDGFPVDPNRISEFMIRSAQGDVFIFHDGQTRWIPSSRVARRVTGLEETKLLYSVISVTIDGSNVVNQSQQRFYTYPTENWPISLLLYSLRISTRDGLFGTPVGKSVNLEFPDGKVLNFPLTKDGTVVVRSLARGNYYMELVGTNGMKSRTPVALSRNQDVNTNVITYLDLIVVGFLGALLAIGLLLVGRPGLRDLKSWRKPVVEPEVANQPLPLPVPDPRRGTGPLSPRPEMVMAVEGESQGELYVNSRLRYNHLSMYDDQEFKQAVGIEREQFEKLHSYLQQELKKNGYKLSLADQLLMTIVKIRENPRMVDLAPAFGINPRTAAETFKRIRTTLVKFGEFNQLADGLKPALRLLPAAVAPQNIEPAQAETLPAPGDD